MLDAESRKNTGEQATPRAVHAVDGVLLPGLRNPLEIGKRGDSFDVGADKINLGDFRACRRSLPLAAQLPFEGSHDRRTPRPAIESFVFHAIPVVGIMA